MAARVRRFEVWMLAAAVAAWTWSAHAVRLRVRGGSVVELRAFQRSNAFVVRGAVTDDVGATLGRVSVKLAARTGRLGAPLPCTGAEAAGSARSEGPGWTVVTDERGQFCVRSVGPAPSDVTAEFVGNNLFEGGRAEARPIAESEQRAGTTIRFESAPSSIDLDRESFSVTVGLRVDRGDAQRLFLAGHARREGLELVLRDEGERELGRARTGGDGRARFEVPTRSLGAPGDGELRVVFDGDAQLSPAQAKTFVSRTATATLSVPSEPAPGDPSGGVPIEVRIQTSRGDVEGGVVEATLRGERVGSAPVAEGRSTVLATFDTAETGAVPIALKYVPAGPHHLAGPTIEILLPLRGPSPLRQLALVVIGAALAAWIVAKWRRAPKPATEAGAEAPPPSGRPEVVVLERPSGLRGWRGVVRDAHDDTPLSAELSIVIPSFEGTEVLARARTGTDGTFSFDLSAPKGARLLIESTLHATFEQALPAPSVLRIALVSRRRALLDRLVGWARRSGAPFDASKDPTPGHVRRVAARSGADDIARWAGTVERAAYGPEPVTREVEQAIEGGEPAPPRLDRADLAPRGARPR